MVLAQLGGSISHALAQISNTTVIDEKVLNDCLNEISRALLQADVQFKMKASSQPPYITTPPLSLSISPALFNSIPHKASLLDPHLLYASSSSSPIPLSRANNTAASKLSTRPLSLLIHGDRRRRRQPERHRAPPRPTRDKQQRRLAEEAVGLRRSQARAGRHQERGLRDQPVRRRRKRRPRPRPRHRRACQGASGRVAAGEGVQEEHLPGSGGEEGRAAAAAAAGRTVCEGQHGRGAVPQESGSPDVQGVQGAQGRAGRPLHQVHLCRRRRRERRRPPARHRLRGQGRRPHARRRRALGYVHLFMQEAQDNEGL